MTVAGPLTLGSRIAPDPSIAQRPDVFGPSTYREFLERYAQGANRLSELGRQRQEFMPRGRQAGSREPERLKAEWQSALDQLGQLVQEYQRRLPVWRLARCPYCEASLLKPVDVFSLAGCYGWANNQTKLYGANTSRWFRGDPPEARCRHALLAQMAVNLNGRRPDDLPTWLLRRESLPQDSHPRLIAWLLTARQTSVVLHAVPIGRLDDAEPVHRYTAYFTAYFAGDKSNVHDEGWWVPTDVGGPATGGVREDDNLLRWLPTGRLHWLDAEAAGQPLVRGPAANFPFGNIQPRGWYKLVDDGRVDGPHPYAYSYTGPVFRHDLSRPRAAGDEYE